MKKYTILAGLLALVQVLWAQKYEFPDYSYCGYELSEREIPTAPVRAVVPCADHDMTADIQAALDYVSSLAPDADGIRGAVLLTQGQYKVSSTLWIRSSGVVLRGSGMHPTDGGTEILATMDDRRTLIQVKGVDDRAYGPAIFPTDTLIPTGSMCLHLPARSGLRAGDAVVIEPAISGSDPRQRGTAFQMERRIKALDGTEAVLDAPLMSDLRSCQLRPLIWNGRIERVGVENLCLNSVYDENNPKDENHCWIAVSMENVQNAWVRRVQFRHFAGSSVFVAETASRLTVEDCHSLEPVSEIGGQRRYTFYVKGPLCLLQRIQAEQGYHDFAVGAVQGPTAFVQCWSIAPFSYSGTIEATSAGVLFDICAVDGNSLRFGQPNPANAFDGCTSANSLMWNSQAAIVSCDKPAFGQNWAYGAWGGFNGKGSWSGANNHSSPWSIFYSQLSARRGQRYDDGGKLITLSGGGTSSVEDARFQTEASRHAPVLLSAWIDTLSQRYPIVSDYDSPMESVWKDFLPNSGEEAESHPIELRDGLMVRDGRILTGTRRNPSWWRGSASQPASADPHLVRYALGPEGYGITDNLDEMTDEMVLNHQLVTDFNYALWYERRRDDHERIARIDGDVRPPLYELPFARSGQGRAYDGLSRYDLTKWNNWYWRRLAEYAEIGDEKGLVLFYHHYFQHNILEAGAHWADFPWRPTNNVNHTGFPDPTPYAGNKRVFMAEHFYDETHPVRRELHRNYIRKCLDNFSETGSVVHFISAEFSGPLHFTQFWCDVIAEWESETGKRPLVAISAPKNVQDSILADEARSAVIDVIDIRYWYEAGNGREFAPDGGLSLSPRQFERFGKPGAASDESVYRMVSHYREQYPGKAVIYSADSYPERAWAAFMAGASLCPLPAGLPDEFLQAAATVKPLPGAACRTLYEPQKTYIVLSHDGQATIDLSAETRSFQAQWIDRQTGRPLGKEFTVKSGKIQSLAGNGVLWLR